MDSYSPTQSSTQSPSPELDVDVTKPKKMDIYAAIVDQSNVGIFVINHKSKLICWNQWMVSSSNIEASFALGKTLDEIFPDLPGLRFMQSINDCINKGMSSLLSSKLNPHPLPLYSTASEQAKGQVMSQMIMVKPVQDQGKLCMVHVFDVSPAKARDQLLRQRTSEYRSKEMHTHAILASIGDAVITTDLQSHIDYMNPIAETMTGWALGESKGRPLKQVFSVMSKKGEKDIDFVERCLSTDEEPDNESHELALNNRDGVCIAIEESVAAIRDTDKKIIGAVVVFRDVSSARKLSQQISWQATHDTLTGLFNRNYFDAKLTDMVTDAREGDRHHALLYLDLDQFKVVNDTCGHVAGDELLRQVSLLLSSHIRANDTLARLGGDEFGIQLLNCPAQVALRIANQTRHSIGNFRFCWEDKSFGIGVSIGLVEVNSQSESVEQVLSDADTACYAAKDNGRNQVHVYRTHASEAAVRQSEMEWVTRIQSAIEQQRFRLYFQTITPVLCLNDSNHIEILIRMLDTDGEVISPGAFIPAAERYNLMPAIDHWVIGKVFQLINDNLMVLIENGYQFAINLSGHSLSGADTLDYICDQLTKQQIPKGMICFEITETAAISNLSSASHFIRTLKQQGCLFSLDDFGSGLSSFAYLKNLPVDYLKIDGSFVKDMATDVIDQAMVQSINQIGHVMNLKTIAEFVESEEILQCLKDIGVDYAQGYAIAKPTPLTDSDGKLLIT
ncbi:MAG: PAS/PAC sensor-containing diguanylate cyclase/phosphodiesterase [Osedax symbiont Rs2]|nr:MAG: PAS/PAC sensor-containing diguanylate cyclase/phosphodiesterase [Osedax symbiont Rs2]